MPLLCPTCSRVKRPIEPDVLFTERVSFLIFLLGFWWPLSITGHFFYYVIYLPHQKLTEIVENISLGNLDKSENDLESLDILENTISKVSVENVRSDIRLAQEKNKKKKKAQVAPVGGSVRSDVKFSVVETNETSYSETIFSERYYRAATKKFKHVGTLSHSSVDFASDFGNNLNHLF